MRDPVDYQFLQDYCKLHIAAQLLREIKISVPIEQLEKVIGEIEKLELELATDIQERDRNRVSKRRKSK